MSKNVELHVFRGAPDGSIVRDTVQHTLQPTEAVIQVTHAGLCGSDHLFKTANIALGHEGVGFVRDVGSRVTCFGPGDRVGFGWTKKVDSVCDYCLSDRDQYCLQREQYGSAGTNTGSLADYAVWDESALIKLPDAIPSELAAPLMCGGATVWSALTTYDLKPGDRVGIHGIGGLGHMAIQFAAALGCEVVVFSGSKEKEKETRELGAREFHVLKDGEEEMKVNPVRHLLVTGSGAPDYKKLFSLMAFDSTLYLLSVTLQDPPVPSIPLVQNGIRIQGSCVSSRLTTKKMMRFVALHGIKPIIMTWPMTEQGIQDAFTAMEEGRIRYRGVLVPQT